MISDGLQIIDLPLINLILEASSFISVSGNPPCWSEVWIDICSDLILLTQFTQNQCAPILSRSLTHSSFPMFSRRSKRARKHCEVRSALNFEKKALIRTCNMEKSSSLQFLLYFCERVRGRGLHWKSNSLIWKSTLTFYSFCLIGSVSCFRKVSWFPNIGRKIWDETL